jgi:DNA repair protein RadD
MKQLRPYQTEAIKALWSAYARNRNAVPLLVLPTGSGKSLVLAEIIKQLIAKNPRWRILVVTHRKELVDQNAKEIHAHTGKAVGIVSAGLGKKTVRQITCANIQSIFKNPGTWECVIVDESHLISGNDNSMYGKLFQRAGKPIICGLTATPYRLDMGLLVGERNIFTEIAYSADMAELIAQGYLAPLISVSKEKLDLSQVRHNGNEFNQADLEATLRPLSAQHANSILSLTKDRKHVLVFCSGVAHAAEMASLLGGEHVTGGMDQLQRDRIINRFKDGFTKYLCNCEILTTGFNFPAIDCIVLLRPTESIGLYIQQVGRGSRTAEAKENTLILDYSGNIERHGPIDAVQVIQKPLCPPEFRIAPVKACSECGCVVPIAIMVCPLCHAAFPAGSSNKLKEAPSSAPILSTNEEAYCTDSKAYIGKTGALVIKYETSVGPIWDSFCFEHEQEFPRRMAVRKWSGLLPAPSSCLEGLDRAGELKRPRRMTVKKDGKYFRILKVLEYWDDFEVDDDLSLPNI